MLNPVTPKALNLVELACIYNDARRRTGDHRAAFVETCRWAIPEGYRAAACWVSLPMLAAKKATHAVALRDAAGDGYYLVGVGGVSLSHGLEPMFNGDRVPGWRMLADDAAELYRQWATFVPVIGPEGGFEPDS